MSTHFTEEQDKELLEHFFEALGEHAIDKIRMEQDPFYHNEPLRNEEKFEMAKVIITQIVEGP